MGIGKRISRIIKSNVNDLLSAAEDPDKQLDLLISEMDDALRKARQQLVEQMALEKRLQRQLDEADELTRLWQDKAQTAVNAGEDELARQALRKKRTYEELATQYDQQLYEQQTAVDEMRESYKQLEQKLKESQAKRGRMKAERRVSRPTSTGSSGARRVETGSLVDRSAFDKFDEMADKVENFEAETQAQRELQDYLEPDEGLAEKIDDASSGGGRRSDRRERNERDLQLDIELEEMRKQTGGRKSRRERPAEPTEPAAPAAKPTVEGEEDGRLSRRRSSRGPQEPRGEGDPKPDGDDEEGGWGRRVEL